MELQITQIATGKVYTVRAATYADAMTKFRAIRTDEMNAQFAGVKRVNTTRCADDANGNYECKTPAGVRRFHVFTKFFVPSAPTADRVAIMDERGEAAMRRGFGHY